MKLNNTLIVTLPDFARHFSFAEFWENRRQFVRDMHPQKVYYWSDELSQAYYAVVAWIEKGDEVTAADRQAGLKALEMLVGRSIDIKNAPSGDHPVDLSSPVICVQAGKSLALPAYKPDRKRPLSLILHKIEVHGKHGAAMVSIGNGAARRIDAGDFVYVTAVEGCGFVEFLPKSLRNASYGLTAVSQEGEFASSLIVRTIGTMQQEEVRGVVSFALTDDGYVYVNAGRKLIVMSNIVLGIKVALVHNADALYVKSHGNDVAVLYADGILKSVEYMQGRKNTVSAGFDERGKLHLL